MGAYMAITIWSRRPLCNGGIPIRLSGITDHMWYVSGIVIIHSLYWVWPPLYYLHSTNNPIVDHGTSHITWITLYVGHTWVPISQLSMWLWPHLLRLVGPMVRVDPENDPKKSARVLRRWSVQSGDDHFPLTWPLTTVAGPSRRGPAPF